MVKFVGKEECVVGVEVIEMKNANAACKKRCCMCNVSKNIL